MDSVKPIEISKFINLIASGIDASTKPNAKKVANDVKIAIAALEDNPDAVQAVKKAIAASPAPSQPTSASKKEVQLSATGELTPKLMDGLGAAIAQKLPEGKGKKLRYEVKVSVSD